MTAGWWTRDLFGAKLPYLKKRDRVIKAIRAYFDNKGFLEVETPIMQVSPGLEPHLHAFRTEYIDPAGEDNRTYYLHTSPEFTMKKLLAAGVPRMYQITKVFRNRERSDTHSPEFTMIEWYRANETYEALMKDCENLVRECFRAAGRQNAEYDGTRCDPFDDFEYLTVNDAFKNATGADLLETITDYRSHDPCPRRIMEVARSLGDPSCEPQEYDRWEDVFFRIYMNKIERKLGRGRPTILYDYPLCLAALSRPKPSDPRVAERFEMYICGLELANAFGELTDADVQLKRFQADMDIKEELYGERYPIDMDFIAALKYGMPESSGISIGVDRLVMLCTGAEKISDVLWADV